MSQTPKDAPPQAAPRWTRQYTSATAVGAFVPKVARPAFEAHGFPHAALIADWETIAGADLARISAPERLVWPRRGEAPEEDRSASANKARQRAGATLVLRVEGPRALEVQHSTGQLIERINTYFGYGAVTDLRIVQGPVRKHAPAETAPPETPAAAREDLSHIEDDGLRAALARLGARVD